MPPSVTRLLMSMKGGHVKTTVLTALMLTALIGTGWAKAAQSGTSAPCPQRHLTRKQAARLIYTANTPEEHLELAQYFRQQAHRKRNEAQYYLEVVATYGLHPPRVDSYR